MDRDMAPVEEIEKVAQEGMAEVTAAKEGRERNEVYVDQFSRWMKDIAVPSLEHIYDNQGEYMRLQQMVYENRDVGNKGREFMENYLQTAVLFQINYAKWLLSMPERNVIQHEIRKVIVTEMEGYKKRKGQNAYSHARDQVRGALGAVTFIDTLWSMGEEVKENLTIDNISMEIEADMKGATDLALVKGDKVFQISIKTIPQKTYNGVMRYFKDEIDRGMDRDDAVSAFKEMLITLVNKHTDMAEFGIEKGGRDKYKHVGRKQVKGNEIRRMVQYAERQWPKKDVLSLIAFMPFADFDKIDEWMGFVDFNDKGAAEMRQFILLRLADLGF